MAVFLKQDTNETRTDEERAAAFSVVTQEGVLPTQRRIPPSAFAQIVQVSTIGGSRRLHVLWDNR